MIKRHVFCVFFIACALVFAAGPARGQTLSGATVQLYQTNLTMPSGSSVYLYGMVTGGGASSTSFAQGSYQYTTDFDGYISTALAVTPTNSDSFTTNTGYYAVGGVGVSGYTSMSETYGSNTQTGASQASAVFTLSQTSLVVIIGTASSQQRVTLGLSGGPSLQVAASTGYPDAIEIAYATLGPGTYTAEEQSAALAAGQDPNHMADLIGVFMFTGVNTATLGACSTADPCQTSAEPVDTATGNYFYHHTDLAVPGRGLPFLFQRAYNSLDSYSGPLGASWTDSYNIFLTFTSSGIVVKWGDGHTDTYALMGSLWMPPPGVHNALTQNPVDGTWTITLKNQTQFHFTTTGKLTSIVDKNGNAIQLAYDANGNLAQITDTVGRVFMLAYDSSNRIVSLTDPIGRQVLYTYSAAGDLASVTDAAGNVTTFAYDGLHHVTTITLPNAATLLKNTYDSQSRVFAQTNGRGFTWTWAYDTPGPNQTTITDPLGNVTVHSYDSLLRITSITDALGGTLAYAYDADNNRTSVTNQDGKTTDFTYDAQGNLTSATDPLGKTTFFEYDAKNDLTKITDRLGRLTTFGYDGNGNLTSIMDAAGGTTAFTYGSDGEVLSVRNARDFATALSYDSAGNLTELVDALGGTIRLTYDGVGRLLTVTNQLGNTWSRTYDADDRLLTLTDPLGDTTEFAYDSNGNLTKITDADGNATRYAYDATDKLTQVTDAIGGITRYSYDPDYELASVTDANGHVTTYAYDALGRVRTVTDPLNRARQYAYDGVSNVTAVTDGDGKTNTYAYDSLNRLTSMSLSDGKSVGYSYDAVGNRLSMTDWRGVTNYKYDVLNRVLSVKSPDGDTVGYAYDPIGNRITLTYPDGNAVQYQSDALNRLTGVTDWTGETTNYSYDSAGNMTGMTLPNGAFSSYVYDAANRLTSVVNYTSPGRRSRERSAFRYLLDKVGNRLQVTSSTGQTTHYGYDALDRLTSWTQPSGLLTKYVYDAVGNRLSVISPGGITNYTYDAADELLTAGGASFAYDRNGNRMTETVGGSTISYGWDALNRLISVTGGGEDTQYTYDGDGNRVLQQVAGGTYQYLNDTASALPVALDENGPDGNIRYVYGRSLISENLPPKEYFYQFDGLGSVVNVTNHAGALNANYGYGPWGQAINPSSPPVGLDALHTKNKYRFTAQALDPVTGLYYMRARYYDASVGRFLSRDPMGDWIGSPLSRNPYQYSLANPTLYRDPSGQFYVTYTNTSPPPFISSMSGVLSLVPDLLTADMIDIGAGITYGIGSVAVATGHPFYGQALINNANGAFYYNAQHLVDDIEQITGWQNLNVNGVTGTTTENIYFSGNPQIASDLKQIYFWSGIGQGVLGAIQPAGDVARAFRAFSAGELSNGYFAALLLPELRNILENAAGYLQGNNIGYLPGNNNGK